MQATIWREALYLRKRNLLPRDWPVAAEALSLLTDGYGGAILSIGDLQREASKLRWTVNRYTEALEKAAEEGWLAKLDWERGTVRTTLTIPEET